MKKLLLFITIFYCLNIYAANRFWIAGNSSNWNNTSNWSASSGGTAGVSVPGVSDVVIFDGNGLGNCNLDMAPFIAGLTVNGYTSIIDLNGNVLSITSGDITLTTGTINDVPTTGSLLINSTGNSRFNGTTFGTEIQCVSGRIRLDGSIFNNAVSFTKTAAGNDSGSGGNTFNSTVTLASTAVNYFMTGNGNPDVFNGILTVQNTGTSYIYLGHNSAGNAFNQDVLLESTGTSLGIVVCQNTGANVTFASGINLSTTGGGLTSGDIRIYRSTQLGTTAQMLTTTGTARIYLDATVWNGNVDFSGARIYTRNSTYNGITNFTKTGASDDASAGGNVFNQDLTINNNSTGYIMMGNGNSDLYNGNLIINNSGSRLVYFADNSAGNIVTGNVTVNQTLTGAGIRMARLNGSSLSIGGNLVMNLAGTNNHSDGIAEAGSMIISGDLRIENTSSADVVNIYIANQSTSSITVDGTSTFINSGTGAGTQVFRLAEQGTATFNGIVNALNNSGAVNSDIYFNRGVTGLCNFNGDINITSTVANCDGVSFGENGGSATLADTKTISIGSGGFITGIVYFRNFTQVGSTAQTLNFTGDTYFINYNSNWGGDISITSPKLITRGTTYNGTTYLEKSGGSDDNSFGGNTFVGNCTMVHSSINRFGMGNGGTDVFQGDLVVNNSGGGRYELAMNSAGNSIGGDFTIMNTGAATDIVLASSTGSSLSVGGETVFNNSSTAPTTTVYVGNNGSCTFNGPFTYNNTSTSNTHNAYLSNSAIASVTFGASAIFNNSGTGALTQRIWLGNRGDILCNGVLTLNNNAGANNSEIFCNYNTNSTATFNENIIVENTHITGDGVRFGQGGGSAVLAALKTITISGSGFVAGELAFRNFTQLGSLSQTLIPTGTTLFRSIDSDWGGNIDFRSPRIYTNGTNYNGTTFIEKTGGIGDDQSSGGNLFMGDVTIRNSGTEYIMMGNGAGDICQANLILDNASTAELYWAHNGSGNTVAGNLTATMSAGGRRIELVNNLNSDLVVSGDLSIVNMTSAVSSVITLGNAGDVTVGGNLSYIDNSTGAGPRFYACSTSDASLDVTGNTTLVSNTSGLSDSQFYIGNFGDLTFNGTLTVSNHSAANNNVIRFNSYSTSNAVYNGDIILEATSANSDGILFGEYGGFATLAATKTVTIGGGGFVAGDLRFRNFTQVGSTNQNIFCSGTARFYNYDSNWGGNVSFVAPRIVTRGTVYQGTSYIEKNGASGDNSAGGNIFVGNARLVNSGFGQLIFGDGIKDDWQANLDVENTGENRIIIANNSAGNTIAGNLNWDFTGNSGQNDVISNAVSSTMVVTGTAEIHNSSSAGGDIYIGNSGDITFNSTLDLTLNTSGVSNGSVFIGSSASSEITVVGTVTMDNTSSANTGEIYVGNSGTIYFQDDFIANNAATGLRGRIIIANSVASSFVVDGVSQITNNSTAVNDARLYIGNQGDVTFNDALTVTNNSGESLSHIYVDYNVGSTGLFNGNITLNCTNGTSDGIRFGENNGNGTLAATKTVSIGIGGFVSGDLTFRNFTQTGSTAQNLTATGIARVYNFDSDWGGNVIFIAPRMLTRGTSYNGTSYLEKTGGSDDASVGGNLFVGDCELVNSGSRYFLMGNGVSDVWQGNLSVLNSGSYNMYIAHNSAGNTVAGNLDWVHSGAAQRSYLATNTGSDLTVTGAANFVNTSNSNSAVYIANNGTVNFESTVDATNTPSVAASGQIRFAEGGNAFVRIDGAANLINNGSCVNSQLVAGNAGDIDFNSTLNMVNAGSGTSSYFYLGNYSNSTINVTGNTSYSQSGAISNTRGYLSNISTNTYNGNITIANNASSINSEVYCSRAVGGVSNFNGNVIITSENALCDGVRFGQDGGSGILADGQSINIGVAGFMAGELRFRNFTQLGNTSQNILCSGTARIYQLNSVWNAETFFTSPRYYTRSTTYNENTQITKTGATADDSPGGNVFNGTAIISNTGTGRFRMSNSTGSPDDYNDDVTWIKSGTGELDPTYNNTDTYSGDININSNTQLYFGRAGNGRVLLNGSVGNQNFNDLGTSGILLVRDLQVDKVVGEVNLNIPIEITSELDLDNGVVTTDATNFLYMRDNAFVSSVSDASHIDGPVEKIGNDVFVFPVGDGSIYRPIAMSNPSSGSARFRATYFNEDPNPTYNHISLDPTLNRVSSCEYWTLDRIASTNNVEVTLSWDTPTSCGVEDLPSLSVARWDGAVWRDHGNGGTLGNTTTGTIVSAGSITSFSPFTLASTSSLNPLPIELLSFDAVLDFDQVDLTWITASEVDNDYFTIEKSADGVNFIEIIKVDGAGNSSANLNYETVDLRPFDGMNYYRLKQTDFNGDYEYSQVKSVKVESESIQQIRAYPNPTTGLVYVVGDALNELIVINALGQTLESVVTVNNGNAVVDLDKFEDGIYFVKTKFETIRIVKQ